MRKNREYFVTRKKKTRKKQNSDNSQKEKVRKMIGAFFFFFFLYYFPFRLSIYKVCSNYEQIHGISEETNFMSELQLYTNGVLLFYGIQTVVAFPQTNTVLLC